MQSVGILRTHSRTGGLHLLASSLPFAYPFPSPCLYFCIYESCLFVFLDSTHLCGMCHSLSDFTQQNALRVHPHCCKWQHFLLFITSHIPLYVLYTTFSLSIHPSKDTQVALHVLVIVNNVEMSLMVHLFFKDSDFISFG